MKPHVYEPGRMTKSSHTRDCCDQPAESHLPFVDGTKTRIMLTRDVRGLHGTVWGRGTRLIATRRVSDDGMQEVSPSRWGTNVLGQFAELEKAVYRDVPIPGWMFKIDGTNTVVPLSWGKEV